MSVGLAFSAVEVTVELTASFVKELRTSFAVGGRVLRGPLERAEFSLLEV
jgi:hypothetical protein